ncbi:MAG: N-acetyl-gamma-glutamyl-phosphate reductase [Pelagibacterales bacterium]|jgi:N-acetyl-gamma-glutamyl-phosphate reductase|nr:N-acetyl-gamma-glutamyl-phosphate reductase [Pelagibacterales bacterium]
MSINSKSNIVNLAILGASGYTGAESIRLITKNVNYKIVNLTADSKAGNNISEIFPHLRGIELPKLIKVEDLDFSKIDAVLSCLPHGKTQNILSIIPKHIKICDLSADFRFKDPNLYEKVYEKKHDAINLQKEAVYGLTEINRKKIIDARLIANPGCYPTSALLPLIPLLNKGLISDKNIIIDSKSGVSGAGRMLKENLLFGEVSDGFTAYGLATHRHRPEIQTQLNYVCNSNIKVVFTPHLLPIKRGILSTIYIDIKDNFDINDIKDSLKNTYENEEFVDFIDGIPSTHEVRGTNMCKMGVVFDKITNKAIIISVIDNLVKGAVGQAIQNLNLMMGFNEAEGLVNVPMFP